MRSSTIVGYRLAKDRSVYKRRSPNDYATAGHAETGGMSCSCGIIPISDSLIAQTDAEKERLNIWHIPRDIAALAFVLRTIPPSARGRLADSATPLSQTETGRALGMPIFQKPKLQAAAGGSPLG